MKEIENQWKQNQWKKSDYDILTSTSQGWNSVLYETDTRVLN